MTPSSYAMPCVTGTCEPVFKVPNSKPFFNLNNWLHWEEKPSNYYCLFKKSLVAAYGKFFWPFFLGCFLLDPSVTILSYLLTGCCWHNLERKVRRKQTTIQRLLSIGGNSYLFLCGWIWVVMGFSWMDCAK